MKQIKAVVVCAALMMLSASSEAAPSLFAQEDGAQLSNTGTIYADYGYDVPLQDGSTNFVFSGMGASPSANPFSNVKLQNDGMIYVHTADMCAAAAGGTYAQLMARGMTAAENSLLVNHGTIFMAVDHDSASKDEIFQHGMYAGQGSTVVNNGNIRILGSGSDGDHVRGMTSNAGDLVLINNGVIQIDVADSYMARGLASVGAGSSITNNGLVMVHSDSHVVGLAQAFSEELVNNGTVLVRTEGINPSKSYGKIPAMQAVAYGMTSFGKVAADAEASMYNHGYILAVQPENTQGVKAYAMQVSAWASSASNINMDVTVGNMGIAEAVNGYELGVNTILDYYDAYKSAGSTDTLVNTSVKIPVWTTTLRDFSVNLFALGSKGALDFSDTVFVLRPSDDYIAGQEYSLSQDTMVDTAFCDKITTLTEQNVVGFDQIRFVAEMPDFLQLNLRETTRAAGAQVASLTPTNNQSATEKMLATAALSTVDFARYGLEKLEYGVQSQPVTADGEWNYYAVPYAGKHSRDEGMDPISMAFWVVRVGRPTSIHRPAII